MTNDVGGREIVGTRGAPPYAVCEMVEAAGSRSESVTDEDVVGDRMRLVQIGMLAVFVACVVFGALRLATQLQTGLATPWWGNALSAVLIVLLYLWTRGDRARSGIAVHGTAVVATIALLVPAAYGMTSSKWWLSLVGFSVMLMGRRREALVWTVSTLVLVPLTAILEPTIVVPHAIGEPVAERALAGFLYVALLLAVTFAFRRVVQQRARELAETAASLDRAARVRDRFLEHMSHELRTPLHGVIAMTDLAMKGEASKEVLDQVSQAQGSARALLRLLNDVLDATRAQADAIALHARAFDLHAALSERLGPVASEARARGLELIARAEPGVSSGRIGDRVRFVQIAMNLVDHAIAATDEGRIELRLSQAPDDPDRVRLSVRDTGRGIAKSELARVFEPFAKGAGSDEGSKRRGVGLGLAIVRELVDRMDGTVSVESEVGRGTTFTVDVLCRRDPERTGAGPEDLLAPPKGDAAIVAEAQKGLSILACDDDPLSRRVMTRMLQRLGHRVTMVNDGDEAWDALQKGAFEALVTDIEMPRMDGVELTRAVRAREMRDHLARLPIVAATAHIGQDEEHRLLAAGVDVHLPKPFTEADVARAMSRLTLTAPSGSGS